MALAVSVYLAVDEPVQFIVSLGIRLTINGSNYVCIFNFPIGFLFI